MAKYGITGKQLAHTIAGGDFISIPIPSWCPHPDAEQKWEESQKKPRSVIL